MSDNATSIRRRLDGWREQKADRLNPIRFHLIEVLERRVADQVGEARRVLEARLATLVESYAQALQKSSRLLDAGSLAITPRPSTRSALGQLVDDLATHHAARSPTRPTHSSAGAPARIHALQTLDEFRDVWSHLHEQSHLRQALARSPGDVGPLNSASLVHRSLTLMHQLSPSYLQHFLAYLDALAWMEKLQDRSAVGAGQNPRISSPGKRSRSKPARPNL